MAIETLRKIEDKKNSSCNMDAPGHNFRDRNKKERDRKIAGTGSMARRFVRVCNNDTVRLLIHMICPELFSG